MPVRRLRASVRSVCVARVSCRSLRSSLVRFASAVAPLLFFFSRCAFSRCLLGGGDVIPSGVIAPSRFSCLPPPRAWRAAVCVLPSCLPVIRHQSSVIGYPSDVACRPVLRRLPLSPVCLLAGVIRSVLVYAGYASICSSPRLGVSGCGAGYGGGCRRLSRW